MKQPNLFEDLERSAPVEAPIVPGARPDAEFSGPDYDPERDRDRLAGQIRRVFDLMRDGSYRSLGQIAAETGDPPASISAQLRHLRKPRFGGHTVEKRYLGNGLFVYRLLVAAACNDGR